MVKLDKVFITLILIVLFIPVESVYPRSTLRAPLIFNNDSAHRIIVKRNYVKGEPKGQVTMRVCEISELKEEERGIVAKAFTRWLTDYPIGISKGVIHPKTIELVTDILKFSDYSTLGDLRDIIAMRIYFAISYPQVNGRDTIDVEGFVITVDKEYKSDIAVAQFWEIKPDNRKRTLLQHRRFIGVGSQLLCYAVRRELQKGKKGMIFDLHKKESLESLGLYRHILYDRAALNKFIRKFTSKTIKHLEISAKKKDEGTEQILRQINELQITAAALSL